MVIKIKGDLEEQVVIDKVMGRHKILTDIEAEDKLLGPLTLKQFVYGGIGGIILLVGWMISRNTSMIVFGLFFLVASPFLFLAAPLRNDQPNDIWLFAKINYLFKTRKRVWQQNGRLSTVLFKSKMAEEVFSNTGFKTEDSLHPTADIQDLVNVLDSRGWVDQIESIAFDQRQKDTLTKHLKFGQKHLDESHQLVAERVDNKLNQQKVNARVEAHSLKQNQDQSDSNMVEPNRSMAIDQLSKNNELDLSSISQVASSVAEGSTNQ